MAKTLKTVFSWLLLLHITTSQAQKLRFKHITGEDGLSTGFVKTILQDDKGFMWFGTQDGLNRFDGHQIRVYRRDNTDSAALSSSDITCLLQVRPDLFIVGTRSGLNYFNPVTERFRPLRLPGRAGSARISALLDLDSGVVLAATGEGLVMLRLRTGHATLLPFNSETRVDVRSLGRFSGSVFAGTATKGLWRLGSNNQMLQAGISNPDLLRYNESDLLHINCIREYGSKMYLGTNAGIFKIDRSLEVQAHISFSSFNPNTDAVRDFIIQNNSICAATAYGTAVYHLISSRLTVYTRQESADGLNSNPCNCIFADRQNNLWIGTDLGGVNVAMYRSLRFPISPFNFEGSYDNIYSFGATEKDRLMVGGVQTLAEVNFATGSSRDFSKVLGSGTARCLYAEDDRVVWIGTWGNGILRLDKSTGKSENMLRDIPGATVLALYKYNGFLFAATAGDGLFRIDMQTRHVTRYGEGEGLPGLNINCLFADSKGFLWIGTYDAGLAKVSIGGGGEFEVVQVYRNSGNPGDISSNVVFGVNEAPNGAIWAATSSGLSKLLPDGTFHNFGLREGLSNTFLYALLRDSVGQFWTSSNAGLFRFDPGLPHEAITFKSYGLKDGLLNTGYNPGAALSMSTGLMYFGGSKGFNAFRPTSIRNNLHPPPVYIVGYNSGGRTVETDTLITYKKHLELEWDQNSFQFELTALDYTDPSKNLFSYKLEGYDADWSEPGHVRYVSYTELPGGLYTFKVKAANNDGVWNEKPMLLSVRVVPPFWHSSFFYFLVIMTGIAAVYGFTLLRTRAIRRENVMLEKKVAERTRELEARNRDITSSIEYARRIQEAILPSRDHIFQKLKKVFIFYKPKDIVSGDFYWFAEKDGVKIFAVVDCTGHGVPGAFMSMIGHNLLDQVVTELGITDPGDILNHLHRGVTTALRQGHNEVSTNDGMDVSVIAINDTSREVRWAGANRPLILIDADSKFTRYDGNKDPVGGVQAHLDRTFTTHVIRPEVAAMAYLFSDGYADQFGGERGKKFMVKRFHQVLVDIHRLSPDAQQAALDEHFERWRQNHEQVDDVLIVGIEI